MAATSRRQRASECRSMRAGRGPVGGGRRATVRRCGAADGWCATRARCSDELARDAGRVHVHLDGVDDAHPVAAGDGDGHRDADVAAGSEDDGIAAREAIEGERKPAQAVALVRIGARRPYVSNLNTVGCRSIIIPGQGWVIGEPT